MQTPHSKSDPVTYFGQTDSRGRRTPFGIKQKDRSRHMYVIGKTGMGKSTLLENMAIQDIKSGNGVCFVDPHGKTADLLLDYVPEERKNDVLYFAPFDMDYPVSFNIMEDVGVDRRHLVVNGLMATFEKIWVDAWSARMAYILQNTLLALLEYPGSTLLGVNRMLVDKEYRKLVVGNVTDPSVRSFWVDEFAKYTDRYTQEATPAIQNKVGQFTSNPLIRNIVGQPHSTFDIRKFMDEGKILIINLSKGKVGEGNANLLGSMLITKVYLAAMSRADVTETELQKLPNFYLYVDEFQSFANKSFADILSEARKYKLNLTLAHQYIEQMEEEVRAAVFGNVGTMVVFRVGAYDAEVLEKEFAPFITAEDLVNLGIYQIYLKLMINGVTSSPFSATTLSPIERGERVFRSEIIDRSRQLFARSRATVEEEIKAWHAPIAPPPREREGERPPGLPMHGPRTERSEGREPPRERGDWRPSSNERPREPRSVFPRPHFDPTRTPPPPMRNADGASAMSLADLRSGVKKEKVGMGAHLTELRKALSDVLKSPDGGSTNPLRTSPEPETAPKEHKPARTSEASSRVSHEASPSSMGNSDKTVRVSEIPEDELKKLLHVEAPGNREEER
jgi:hypothetical protein